MKSSPMSIQEILFQIHEREAKEQEQAQKKQQVELEKKHQEENKIFIEQSVDKYLENHPDERIIKKDDKFFHVKYKTLDNPTTGVLLDEDGNPKVEYFDSVIVGASKEDLFFKDIKMKIISESAQFKYTYYSDSTKKFYFSDEEIDRIDKIKENSHNYNANTDPTIKDKGKDLKDEHKEPSKTSTTGSPDFDDNREKQDKSNEEQNKKSSEATITSEQQARVYNEYVGTFGLGIGYRVGRVRKAVTNSKAYQFATTNRVVRGIGKVGSSIADVTGLTKDTRKFYFYEKFGITTSSTNEEKKACMQAIEESKLMPTVRKEMSKGKNIPLKIAYGIIGGLKWIGNTLNQKFFYMGKRLESIATGQPFKLKQARKFYENNIKFLEDEKKAVLDYNTLKSMGQDEKANNLLKDRTKAYQKLSEAQIKEGLDPSFASPEVKNMMDIYNRNQKTQEITTAMIQGKYENSSEYLKDLNALNIRLTNDYKLEKDYIERSQFVQSDYAPFDEAKEGLTRTRKDDYKQMMGTIFGGEMSPQDLNNRKTTNKIEDAPELNEALTNNPDNNEISADNYEIG